MKSTNKLIYFRKLSGRIVFICKLWNRLRNLNLKIDRRRVDVLEAAISERMLKLKTCLFKADKVEQRQSDVGKNMISSLPKLH